MTTGDPVLDFALSLRDPALTALMRAVSAASSPEAYFLLLPVVYWVVSRRAGLLLFVADAIATLAAVIAKDIVAAPRPPDSGESAWLAPADTVYAFPSGHATSTASTCASGALLKPSLRAGGAAALLTAAVSFSRLYLGVHWFADVAAGAALGAAVAAAVVLLAPRVGPAVARLPLAAQAALGLLFLAPLALNSTPPALFVACAAAGAFCGHPVAGAWGWKLKTGWPATLPAFGALRLALGIPFIIAVGVGLGDPLAAPPAEAAARFLFLGVFVTLLGPRLFMAVEKALPWDEGFRRRPSH